MVRDRLLERIARWERASALRPGGPRMPLPRSRETGTAELRQSLVGHLMRLFNTRRGNVPMDDAFGVGDFIRLGSGMSRGEVADIESQLQRIIERYEPRLRDPCVRLRRDHSDALTLDFTLEATIAPADQPYALHLSTRIDALGRVRVDAATPA